MWAMESGDWWIGYSSNGTGIGPPERATGRGAATLRRSDRWPRRCEQLRDAVDQMVQIRRRMATEGLHTDRRRGGVVWARIQPREQRRGPARLRRHDRLEDEAEPVDVRHRAE